MAELLSQGQGHSHSGTSNSPVGIPSNLGDGSVSAGAVGRRGRGRSRRASGLGAACHRRARRSQGSLSSRRRRGPCDGCSSGGVSTGGSSAGDHNGQKERADVCDHGAGSHMGCGAVRLRNQTGDRGGAAEIAAECDIAVEYVSGMFHLLFATETTY